MFYIITKKHFDSKEFNVWFYSKESDWNWDKVQFSGFYVFQSGRCGLSNKTKLQTKRHGVHGFATLEEAYASIDYPQ